MEVRRSVPSLLAGSHDKMDWKDTRVGAVLPERAPSKGLRSTSARATFLCLSLEVCPFLKN